MAKGYWIVHVEVADPVGYKQYVALNAKAFAKYGARFLVRGGQSVLKSGSLRPRHVVIEFDSYEAALACYESPEYREAMAVRDKYAKADLVVVEGWAG